MTPKAAIVFARAQYKYHRHEGDPDLPMFWRVFVATFVLVLAI